jgi:capsular polysaccharide transport system ATP-binding protein
LTAAPRPASLTLRERPPVEAGRRIRVSDLVKEYHTPIGRRRVLDGISFDVGKGERIAIVGRNGAGKTTLFKMLSGVERPTSGTIERGLYMSWPLGFSGGLSGEMTGRDNARFIGRLYDKPIDEVIGFVDDFAELGAQLDVPVRDYSTGMQARLNFALTLAIDFECFLIDEVLSVGDQRFHRKCHEALFVTRKDCAMILISHDVHIIREFCSKVLVLKSGRGRVFGDVEFALKIYTTL